MINYKVIADDVEANNGGVITGADYEVHFARMSAETVTTDKVGMVRCTEGRILSGLGRTAGNTLISVLEANLSGAEIRILQNGGIDVNDPETKLAIEAMRPLMGDVAADFLLAESKETNAKWRGLKPGHVQNAIQWREMGEI